MRTHKQQIRRNSKPTLLDGIAVKLVLVTVSFLQTYGVCIAFATGTIAAAMMFGDKGYMTNLAEKTQMMLKEGKSKDAVQLLESQITEYHKWRLENLKDGEPINRLPDLHFLLAKAKESAGVPADQSADDYKKAVFSKNNAGHALVWLYKNLTPTEYKRLVKDYIESTSGGNSKKFKGSNIVKQFEQTQNWPAFEEFIKTAFTETKEPVEYAKIFEQELKDGAWLKEYMDYCRTRPDLLEYVFEKDYKLAEQYKRQKNFTKAVEVYEGILKASGSNKDTSQLKLTICETLFSGGEYQKAISKLDALIAEYKATQRSCVKDAILTKGKAYIQLGEVDKATNAFSTFIIEYPETEQAPEANFFIGYCYMLQNKFDHAKEALNLVIKDYPQSSYAGKAKLSLSRIESMTE